MTGTFGSTPTVAPRGSRQSASFTSSLKDPNEAAQAQADFYARNREVRRMLDEKGFTLEGVVHPSVAINHYLLTGGAEEDCGSEP